MGRGGASHHGDAAAVAGVPGAHLQVDVAAVAARGRPGRQGNVARSPGRGRASGELHVPAHSSAPRISSVNRHLAAAACVALTAGELYVAAIGVLSSPSGHHDVAAGVPLATLAGSRSDNNVAALGADAVEVVAVASTARDEHAPAGVAGGSGLPSRDLDIASVASVATANLQLDVATHAGDCAA